MTKRLIYVLGGVIPLLSVVPIYGRTCNHSNYRNYIFNSTRTQNLIRNTGRGCQLYAINLSSDYIQNADFTKANMSMAKLRGASAQQSLFTNTKLNSADFSFAWADGSNFQEANLQQTDFQSSSLKNTNLYRADMKRAKLQYTDLSGANLERTKLYQAEYNRHTVFPDDFSPVSRGMILK